MVLLRDMCIVLGTVGINPLCDVWRNCGDGIVVRYKGHSGDGLVEGCVGHCGNGFVVGCGHCVGQCGDRPVVGCVGTMGRVLWWERVAGDV